MLVFLVNRLGNAAPVPECRFLDVQDITLPVADFADEDGIGQGIPEIAAGCVICVDRGDGFRILCCEPGQGMLDESEVNESCCVKAVEIEFDRAGG